MLCFHLSRLRWYFKHKWMNECVRACVRVSGRFLFKHIWIHTHTNFSIFHFEWKAYWYYFLYIQIYCARAHFPVCHTTNVDEYNSLNCTFLSTDVFFSFLCSIDLGKTSWTHNVPWHVVTCQHKLCLIALEKSQSIRFSFSAIRSKFRQINRNGWIKDCH